MFHSQKNNPPAYEIQGDYHHLKKRLEQNKKPLILKTILNNSVPA